MAKVDIWRIAYCLGDDENTVLFSNWVTEAGLEEEQEKIMAINPPADGSPGGVEPTILALEKKKLETL